MTIEELRDIVDDYVSARIECGTLGLMVNWSIEVTIRRHHKTPVIELWIDESGIGRDGGGMIHGNSFQSVADRLLGVVRTQKYVFSVN